MCWGQRSMTSITCLTHSKGTLSWNKSPIEHTNTRRGLRQRNGCSKRDGMNDNAPDQVTTPFVIVVLSIYGLLT